MLNPKLVSDKLTELEETDNYYEYDQESPLYNLTPQKPVSALQCEDKSDRQMRKQADQEAEEIIRELFNIPYEDRTFLRYRRSLAGFMIGIFRNEGKDTSWTLEELCSKVEPYIGFLKKRDGGGKYNCGSTLAIVGGLVQNYKKLFVKGKHNYFKLNNEAVKKFESAEIIKFEKAPKAKSEGKIKKGKHQVQVKNKVLSRFEAFYQKVEPSKLSDHFSVAKSDDQVGLIWNQLPQEVQIGYFTAFHHFKPLLSLLNNDFSQDSISVHEQISIFELETSVKALGKIISRQMNKNKDIIQQLKEDRDSHVPFEGEICNPFKELDQDWIERTEVNQQQNLE